ncbi:hypothetical protein QTI66_32715 [Variovorax sp. J22R133]|uniref:hypothetical protein n=1 Tax=Variovorax brevis TaxID=3053503 RepID=UPI0025784DCA|nr:hypothetical protein [Variovorax sp. J22R133]MDM0116891.1 hypothetical protein [Variovorax sp. J22R133]
MNTTPASDPTGYLRKARAYKRWAQSVNITGVPTAHRPPNDYFFIANFPDNFAYWREQFEVHYAIKRLTGK